MCVTGPSSRKSAQRITAACWIFKCTHTEINRKYSIVQGCYSTKIKTDVFVCMCVYTCLSVYGLAFPHGSSLAGLVRVRSVLLCSDHSVLPLHSAYSDTDQRSNPSSRLSRCHTHRRSASPVSHNHTLQTHNFYNDYFYA